MRRRKECVVNVAVDVNVAVEIVGFLERQRRLRRSSKAARQQLFLALEMPEKEKRMRSPSKQEGRAREKGGGAKTLLLFCFFFERKSEKRNRSQSPIFFSITFFSRFASIGLFFSQLFFFLLVFFNFLITKWRPHKQA